MDSSVPSGSPARGLNVYGNAWANARDAANGNESRGFLDIENIDSDGDGKINKNELISLALPGEFLDPLGPLPGPLMQGLIVEKFGSGTGTIEYTPRGQICTGSFPNFSCVHRFEFKAFPDQDSIFGLWSDEQEFENSLCPPGPIGSQDVCTLDFDQSRYEEFTQFGANHTLKAWFFLSEDIKTLNIIREGNGNGSVSSDDSLIDCTFSLISSPNCQAKYIIDTPVSLTASAFGPPICIIMGQCPPGSVFAGWSGDLDCLDGEIQMTQDLTCVATFNEAGSNPPTFFPLTVLKAGTGSGFVTSSNIAGITCGGDCSEAYANEQLVTLTASSAEDSVFSGWSGENCIETDPCSLPMNAARMVTAIFELDEDLDEVPDDVEDAAPFNGDGNQDGFQDSTQANVTSIPNNEDGQYLTLVSPEGTTLQGVESQGPPSLDNMPTGAFPLGFISFALMGVDVGGASTVTWFFSPGVSINTFYKFGPTPDNATPHWYEFLFDGITGAELLSDRIVLHFIDGGRGDHDLTANGQILDPGGPAFEEEQLPILTITKVGTGSGIVTSNDGFIDCGTQCTSDVPEDQQVELLATPDAGSLFTSFTGDSDCVDGTLTMDVDKTCIATFELDTTNPIALDVDGNGVADALTDGMLILRYLFGFKNEALVNGVLAVDATRTTPAEILAYLDPLRTTLLDVDGNGKADAFTDGMLIARFLMDFTGDALTNGVVDPSGTRTSAADITGFLSGIDSLGIDDDGDGVTENQGDCDDTNPTINPNATDIPDNGIDEDCDGVDAVTPDTTFPSIAFQAPVNNALIVQSRPTLDVTFSDDESGVDEQTLAFAANGVPFNVTCTFGASAAQCDPTTDLPEGAVTLLVMIDDQAENTGTALIDIMVDTQPVAISFNESLQGIITSSTDIQVTGKVGEGVTSVVINGVNATFGSPFSATVPLREGTNMIVAVATNANGKTGTDTVEVTRDNVSPIVRITSPRDGFVSIVDTIDVTGLVNDLVSGATEPQIFVNGAEATVGDGGYMVLGVPLVNGPNTLKAIATDRVGNVGTHEITVNFQSPVGLRLGVISGNGQADFVNQQLPNPLVVQVTDDNGAPSPNRLITYDVTRNSGGLQLSQEDSLKRTLQVLTDANGQASALFTLGDTSGEGNNRVSVVGQGVAGELEFCASSLVGEADKILVDMGGNQRGTTGNPLANPFVALVVDADGNPAKDIPVTFTVTQGTGNIDGATTVVKNTGMDGIVRVVLTLGLEPGINNNIVTGTFNGLAGLPATFVASALLPGNPDQTSFSGVVLDNGLTPIPGAVVSIDDTVVSPISTTTNEEGQFLLEGVPVGHVHLHIDPTNSPRLETFPPLAFETVTIAGQVNTLGQPILIPALQTENSQLVGGDQDVILTMPGVEGLSLKVFANSVTCPDGSSQCQVTISQVHLDKVPMPPPGGITFMPPTWTIQSAGTHFDPPAQITIPNNGLLPGRVIDIFQFDHDLNQFVNVGTGTVSEDGSVITSDPGFGITAAGWGGDGPPTPPPTGADPGENCELLDQAKVQERDQRIARASNNLRAANSSLRRAFAIKNIYKALKISAAVRGVVFCIQSRGSSVLCATEIGKALESLGKGFSEVAKMASNAGSAALSLNAMLTDYAVILINEGIIQAACTAYSAASVINSIQNDLNSLKQQLSSELDPVIRAIEGDLEATRGVLQGLTGAPL